MSLFFNSLTFFKIDLYHTNTWPHCNLFRIKRYTHYLPNNIITCRMFYMYYVRWVFTRKIKWQVFVNDMKFCFCLRLHIQRTNLYNNLTPAYEIFYSLTCTYITCKMYKSRAEMENLVCVFLCSFNTISVQINRFHKYLLEVYAEEHCYLLVT